MRCFTVCWELIKRHLIHVVFILIFLVISGLAGKHFLYSSDSAYINLCLSGTADELKRSMDKNGKTDEPILLW